MTCPSLYAGEACHQFGDGMPLPGELSLLVPDLLVLLLKFVQQHRGQLVILHCLDFALGRTNYEVRIHLGEFFGNQAGLHGTLTSSVFLLVAEHHRP